MYKVNFTPQGRRGQGRRGQIYMQAAFNNYQIYNITACVKVCPRDWNRKMKRIALFIIFFITCFSFFSPARAETVEISVMTYNIKAATHQAVTLSTEQNLEMIAEVIEKDKPDVLFLQEVMRFDPLVDDIDEFQWLKDRLDYPEARYASGAKDPVAPGTPEWGVSIYLKTGTILGSEKYRLGNNRALLRVTASINNAPVHFFCTHLGSGEIPRQAELVGDTLSYYTPLREPVVLGGDFNAEPGADALSPISNLLENVFRDSEEKPIDFFFISSDIDASDARIIADPTEASDHEPVAALLNIPLYRRDLILEENFDGHEDINKLNKSPWWTRFGGAGNCRFDVQGGEACSAPNVLYIMRAISSNGGEQFQWLPRKPSPSEPVRFTWRMKHNQDHVAKGSVLASEASSYKNAVVSWYDPDPQSTTYGIRCYNTFETGGKWSGESVSFDAPKYPQWNTFELLCMGTEQRILVNGAQVGVWGPATDPVYDKFYLWQWGRCNAYEDHNPADEGLMWIDDVSIKVESAAPENSSSWFMR